MIEPIFSIDEQRTLLELCFRFEDAWEHGDRRSAAEWLSTNYSDAPDVMVSVAALTELKLVELELRTKYEILTSEATLLNSKCETRGLPKSEINQPKNERYRFLREIARGGAGVIWHVFDFQLHRFSAIKLLLESQDNREMRRRLTQEARICASLQHPGIVPIHELSVLNDGRPFINMKLIDGKTLDEILAETGSHSQKHLLRVFRHVCEAMSYAHGQGVIHRDLKPSNIMVGAFDEVQIMDWGLAKVIRRPVTADWLDKVQADSYDESASIESLGSDTIVGSVFGTLSYMSPEQARGELESVEMRSDVFALGGVLCKILTGSPIYVEADIVELRALARRGITAAAIARIRKSRASKAIKSLAISCIQSDPAKRPADGRDLIRNLDRIEFFAQLRRRFFFAILALAIGLVCFFIFELISYLSLQVMVFDADGTMIESR